VHLVWRVLSETNVFVNLGYEIPVDRALFLSVFIQNFFCGDNLLPHI